MSLDPKEFFPDTILGDQVQEPLEMVERLLQLFGEKAFVEPVAEGVGTAGKVLNKAFEIPVVGPAAEAALVRPQRAVAGAIAVGMGEVENPNPFAGKLDQMFNQAVAELIEGEFEGHKARGKDIGETVLPEGHPLAQLGIDVGAGLLAPAGYTKAVKAFTDIPQVAKFLDESREFVKSDLGRLAEETGAAGLPNPFSKGGASDEAKDIAGRLQKARGKFTAKSFATKGSKLDQKLAQEEKDLREIISDLDAYEKQVFQEMTDDLRGENALYKRIRGDGGIDMRSADRDIWVGLKNNSGRDPSDMADLLGFNDAEAMFDAIEAEARALKEIPDRAHSFVRGNVDFRDSTGSRFEPEQRLARIEALRKRFSARMERGPRDLTIKPDVEPTVINNASGEPINNVWPPIDGQQSIFDDGAPPRRGFVTREFAFAQQGYRDLPERDLFIANTPQGSAGTMDYLRAIKWVEKKENGPLRKAFRKVEDANFNRAKELEDFGTEMQNVIGNKGRMPHKDSNEQIFKHIEGRADRALDEDELRIVEWGRAKYKDLLQRVNAERVKVGLDEIPEIDNYVSHIFDISLMDEVWGLFTKESREIWDIAKKQGIPSKTPATFFANRRKGALGFREDFSAAMKAYAPVALRNIHMLAPVDASRAYVKHLPPRAQTYFTKWLDEGALGRVAGLDQQFDPKVTNVTAKIGARVARNLIVGNLGTAALQLSSLAHVITEAGLGNTVKAIGADAMPSLLKKVGGFDEATQQAEGLRALAWSFGSGWDFAKANSKTLQARRFQNFEDMLPESQALSRFEEIANLPLQTTDAINVAWSFNAGYMKARKQLGMDHAEAIQWADDFATRTQAQFDRLYKSPILRNRMVSSTVGQFQTWTTNFFNWLGYDLVKNPDLSSVDKLKQGATLVGSIMAINHIYGSMGLRPPFEVPSSIVPFSNALGAFTNVPGFKEPGRSGAPAGFQSAVDFGSSLKNVVSEQLFNTRTRRQEEADVDKLIKSSARLFPPSGGNAIQKLLLGARDAERGFSRAGNKRIPMTRDDSLLGQGVEGLAGKEGVEFLNILRSLTMGSGNRPAVREGFENDGILSQIFGGSVFGK